MKKICFLLILLAAISPIFAQSNSGDNSSPDIYYYLNVRIERIYPTSRGFLVRYLKINGDFGIVGIPNEWFIDTQNDSTETGIVGVSSLYTAAGKAEIINLPLGSDWPSMSVFYADGEFSHVKLYVHRSRNHLTWSYIPQGTDLSRYFTSRESLDIQF
ncbi:MAG: hypothetical protein LBQ89_01805 [Treponema sp.]|jgi:hypothetical protein|nr:hypothetical protein [Treponema sp.]